MTTAELIEKLERAEGPSRELFEAAWVAIHHEGYGPENERDTCRLCERFNRMLDAEAWDSAALMLVPEGWTTAMHQQDDGGWSVQLKDGYCTSYKQVVISNVHSPYPPLAFALCIAALKAKEADNG